MSRPGSGKSTEQSPTKLFQQFAAGLWNSEGDKKKLRKVPPLSDAPQLARLSELISSSSHRPASGIPAPNEFATEPDFRAGVTSDEEASTSAPSVTRTRRQPFRRKSVVSSRTSQDEDKYSAFAATEHSLKQQNGRRGSFDQQASHAAVTKPWTDQVMHEEQYLSTVMHFVLHPCRLLGSGSHLSARVIGTQQAVNCQDIGMKGVFPCFSILASAPCLIVTPRVGAARRARCQNSS